MSGDSKRLLHLDCLRVIAIFFVIFNHTGERGYFLFADRMGCWEYFPCMMVSVFCKVAVPIFFMISGALLLPKQESLGQLFTKRVLRMFVVLLLISVPYYIWLHKDQGLNLYSFLTYIYENSASSSLWYLYSYIALLLMMPFMRSMVKSMKEKDFLYLIGGYILLVGIKPCMELFLWKNSVTSHESFNPILFLAPNVFYALAGYYVEYVISFRKNRRLITLGIVLSVLSVAATCFMTYYQTAVLSDCGAEQMEQLFNSFICIPAITLYYITKCVAEKIRSSGMNKVLPFLGSMVFGVFLIEKISRAATDFVYVWTIPVVGSFIASLCWVIVAFCLSFAVIAVLKNMPGIKKIVNRFI